MNESILRVNLEYITQRRKLPQDVSLPEVLAYLDEVAKGPDLPERLEHYLSKRSYVKALEWLDNPDLPHQV
jgi:hypothetical protein